MKKIKRIIFTGGPCSGKTTFMSRAEEIFAERGYRVIVDHESATDLISGGISPATIGMYEFQKYVIDLQLKKEDLCYKAAQEIDGDKVLIFIDRGLRDDESYVGAENFEKILSDFDIKVSEVNDRYDLVIHLVTSAKGKEEAYSNETNSARYETVEQARVMDDLALEAWKSHPSRVIIGNETDFEVKMRKAIQTVFEYLGDEKPVEVFKKYLVEVDNDTIEKIKLEQNLSFFKITQNYLRSNGPIERRIRKREKNGSTLYYYSESQTISTSERIKKDRILSERQYFEYVNEIDKDIPAIEKERYSFIYNNHFFKLDIFDFDKSKGLLAIQIPEIAEEAKMPEYIKVIKDVSENVYYKNHNLAKARKY